MFCELGEAHHYQLCVLPFIETLRPFKGQRMGELHVPNCSVGGEVLLVGIKHLYRDVKRSG